MAIGIYSSETSDNQDGDIMRKLIGKGLGLVALTLLMVISLLMLSAQTGMALRWETRIRQ